MAPWIYNKKLSVGMQIMFGMQSFTVEEDDDPEHSTQEQEE
jgi:hypothetical protein